MDGVRRPVPLPLPHPVQRGPTRPSKPVGPLSPGPFTPPERAGPFCADTTSSLGGLIATDYTAAAETVAQALTLLDENADFDAARDEDPDWPTQTEGDAVHALRDLRDALAARR